MKKTRDRQKGYIALTSAIILSVLLLAITVSLGFTSFFARLNISDTQSKTEADALAEACVNTALANLAQGSTATGAVAVGSATCNIVSVRENDPESGQTTITTQAFINKAYANWRVIIDSQTFDVIAWQELETL